MSAADAPVLVSACLAGEPCRWDGRARSDRRVRAMVNEGRAIPVCAEVLGGLAVPRPPAEIVGGTGSDVLDGTARVLSTEGEDLSGAFIEGARRVAERAEAAGARLAILHDRSPSCGCARIHDGSFSGRLIAGEGVLAALLRSRGLLVLDPDAALGADEDRGKAAGAETKA